MPNHTLLLLHGDEIKDSSWNNVPLQNSGVQVSTAQSKFGGKSLYFNGQTSLVLPANVFSTTADSDFTIDLWCYLTGTMRAAYFLSAQKKAGFMCGANGVGREAVAFDIVFPNAEVAIPANQWLHFAAVRYKGTLTIYVNGKALVQKVGNRMAYSSLGAAYEIGVQGRALYGTRYSFTGYIDEFRISDVARWTSNFTPPTAPYFVPPKPKENSVMINGTVYQISSGKVKLGGTIREIARGNTMVGGTIRKIDLSPGRRVGDLPVGSIVRFLVGGRYVREFIVVHQGLPSSLYDASCDGTWVLQKYLYEAPAWHTSNINDYEYSEINNSLNQTIAEFDDNIRAAIKQVRIPYRPGSGDNHAPINSGPNGLLTSVFLLSGYEVGYTNENTNFSAPRDGARLAYFNDGSGADSKRVAYMEDQIMNWWLRSPFCENGYGPGYAFFVSKQGNYSRLNCSLSGYCGVRATMILYPDTPIDENNTII